MSIHILHDAALIVFIASAIKLSNDDDGDWFAIAALLISSITFMVSGAFL